MRKAEYLSKEDLDLRPFAQRKHLINDDQLARFLKKCPRRFRRGAVCSDLDDEENQKLMKFAEDLATMLALKNCF